MNEEVRKGTKVRIVKNTAGHGFINGQEVTVTAPAYNGVYATDGVDVWGLGNDDFEAVKESKTSSKPRSSEVPPYD